ARLSALEDRIQADLALGQHAELIGEVDALLIEQPLRERLCGALMLALYRCGRQAEASEVFQRMRRRLVDELGMEPGPELQRLLTQILEQDPTLDVAAAPVPTARSQAHHLPVQLTTFVGRQQDLARVKEIVAGNRLVTLVGPGGMGKTRLALQVASELQDAYPDGVCLVDLAPVTTPDLVAHRLIGALNLEVHAASALLDAAIRRLSTRRMLLVIDNCEHLLG